MKELLETSVEIRLPACTCHRVTAADRAGQGWAREGGRCRGFSTINARNTMTDRVTSALRNNEVRNGHVATLRVPEGLRASPTAQRPPSFPAVRGRVRKCDVYHERAPTWVPRRISGYPRAPQSTSQSGSLDASSMKSSLGSELRMKIY